MRRLPTSLAYSAALVAPLAYALGLTAYYTAARVTIAPPQCTTYTPVVAPLPEPARPACPEPAPEPTPEPPSAPPPLPSTGPGAAMLLLPGQHVQLTDTVDPAWGEGSHRFAPEHAAFINTAITQPAPRDKLPDPLRVLLGAPVVVYGSDGPVCTATLGEQAELLSRRDAYEAPEGFTPEELEAEFSSAMLSLSTSLIPDAGESCAGGLWARSTALSPPRLLTRVTEFSPAADEALRIAKMATWTQSSAYKTMKADYPDYVAELPDGEAPTWRKFLSRHHVHHVWKDDLGNAAATHISYGDLYAGCGDGFWGAYSGVWTTAQQELLVGPDVVAMFDADADGLFEVIAIADSGHELASASAALSRTSAVPFEGCSC